MKKIILFGLALAFLIWLFYFGISTDFSIKHTVLVAFFGSVLITIAAVAFIASLISYSRRNDPNGKPNDWEGYLIFGVILISFFGTGITLISSSTNEESQEFEKYGVFSTGTVTNGQILKSRRSDLSSLTVSYKVDGNLYVESYDMPASQVENYGIGQEVPIVYSKRSPKIFKVVSDKNISAYTKKTEKDINIQDLIEVLDKKTSDEGLMYLNNLNQKWSAKAGDEKSSVIYENKIKNMLIKVIGEEELTWIFSNNNGPLNNLDVEKYGFKALDDRNISGHTYENNNYILNIRRERISNTTNDISQGLEFLQVISLLKK